MSMLEVNNLTVGYFGEAKPAVSDCSFTCASGDSIAILGRNGAGKSTLLKAIFGQLPTWSGSVQIDGQPLSDTKFLGRWIGYVPQDDCLDPYASVKQHFDVQAALFGERGAAASDLVQSTLEKIALESKASTRVESLSGGQKRRVALGLALIGRPKFFIFDEPTSSLDIGAANDFWDTVSEVADITSAGTIFTTHRFDDVERFAKSIIIIDKGSVLASEELAGAKHDLGDTVIIIRPSSGASLKAEEVFALSQSLAQIVPHTLLPGDPFRFLFSSLDDAKTAFDVCLTFTKDLPDTKLQLSLSDVSAEDVYECKLNPPAKAATLEQLQEADE